MSPRCWFALAFPRDTECAIFAGIANEVLGAAIGLGLLFHIPLLFGVLITAADTLLLLWFQSFGIRTIEAFILALIAVMAGCFGIEVLWAKPSAGEMFTGLIPSLNRSSLYVAITMLGATVMPHNMYLHSALVQTRSFGQTEKARRTAYRYNLIDSVVALIGAMLVNIAILVLAAAVFFKRGIIVTEIQQAHVLLAPLLGTSFAGVLFCRGAALLGTILHAYRNHGLAGGDGGLPQLPHAALAAPPDHPLPGHYSGGPHHLHRRGEEHPQPAASEPGRPQHAVAVRHHP
ncbi:MAG TPA: Nramp family divalent metal transporter, partial [Candidatus Solibacter sp.]|nr:Nramp family divalent metal transporter [Candidatus Solibacter sp.]